MNKLISFTQNKKTYAVIAVGLVMGVIQGLDDAKVINFHVPVYLDFILGLLGMGTLRHGVQASTEKTTADLAELIAQVMASVENPTVVQVTAEGKVKQVVQTPAYGTATEEKQTEMLNESQLTKGNQ